MFRRFGGSSGGGGGAGLPAPLSWLSGAGAPTNGVTGAGTAEIGSRYTDTTTGYDYINLGTKAVPDWHGVVTA